MTSWTRMGFLAVLLALAGCDGGGNGNPDGGMGPDSGPTPDSGPSPDGGPPPDGGPTDACGAARAITLTMGEQTLTGDTTGRSSTLALSPECGNGASPQEVLALTVPGTGPMAIEFDLFNDATMFDTLVEVRPQGCDSIEEAQCFDDAGFGETRSAGQVLVEGGDTVHFVMTGYDGSASGAWEMRVDVRPANPPTLTGVDAIRVGQTRYELLVDGMDVDGDLEGVFVAFLDAAGEAIVYDGTDEFGVPFEEDQAGNTTITDALARIFDRALAMATADATQVRVTLVDEVGLTTEPMTFPLRNVAEASVGGTCNAESFCFLGLECHEGTCRVPPAAAALCTTPTASVALMAGPAVSTNGTVSPDEPNLFVGGCGLTTGPEQVFRVSIESAGSFDLVASTDNEATGDADTVVYVQSTCGDFSTERACNDDVGEAYLSTAIARDVSGGETYYVVVETYGAPEAATPFQLDLRLRPVLDAEAPCDPSGEMNRCRTGSCPTGTPSPVCPGGL